MLTLSSPILLLCSLLRTSAYFITENEHSEAPDDKVNDLPGLVFETKYDQYAGYLLGPASNETNYTDTHVFYWYVVSGFCNQYRYFTEPERQKYLEV